jgi:hypothetical protein
MTQIINIRKQNLSKIGFSNLKEWLNDSNNVYIGRCCHYVDGTYNSDFMNPFSLNKFTLKEVLFKYLDYLIENPILIHKIKKLKGKTLGCWCKPNTCHGDIIVLLAENKWLHPLTLRWLL